jgi:hypothetical protein
MDSFDTVTGGAAARCDCSTSLLHYTLSTGYIGIRDIDAILMGGGYLDATNYIPSGFSTLMFETINREEE